MVKTEQMCVKEMLAGATPKTGCGVGAKGEAGEGALALVLRGMLNL